MITLLSAVAEATASAPVGPPAWVGTLQNPLLGGVLVAVLTQIVKAIPQIPIVKGPKVAALAAILSVIVGAISAYAGGGFEGFDVGAAWNILLASVVTLTTAMGAAEATKHAGAALAPRAAEPEIPAATAAP